MSLDIFWFLPTSGDTRYLGVSDSGSAPTNVASNSIGFHMRHRKMP
jgi:alkanesulfonate monooxygenase